MAFIELKSDGFWIKEWIYDEKKGEGEYLTSKLDKCIFEMFQHFYDEIEIIGEVTFKNLIDAFNPKDLFVLGMLTGCNIDNYIHELSTDPGKNEDLIDKIVVQKYYEIVNYTPYGGKIKIESYYTAFGIKNNSTENYSLDFTNWWYYRDVPISINHEAIFFDDRQYLQGKNKEYKGEKFTTETTLLEFLRAIFYELGWWLYPKERDKNKKDLIERIESEDMQLISLEDFLKESNNEDS